MKPLLYLLGAAAIIAGVTAIESRQVAPADDCTPKDLDVRPPELIKPPKVERPLAEGQLAEAGCACGCPCEDGCTCASYGPCSESCVCADYATVGQKSVKENRPMLVLVGGARTMYDAIPDGWLVCRVSSLEGVRGPALVVSTPHNGVPWYVAEFPSQTAVVALERKLAAAFAAMRPRTEQAATVCVDGS